ncbi:MAG TPA: SDR family oxidoreductase [Parachlamydiaceae bacterium]|nr:SDR family oxidoreductase [Parachlamydiaceae bacterium]
MKIAIIGCGYVGSALSAKLKREGHYVTTTTRTHSKVPSLKLISDEVYIIQGYDTALMSELLQDQEAVVLSLAADSQEAYESTYLDTAKAVAVAVESAPKLKHIIYTGSTSVYGDHQGGVVDENTPVSETSANCRILIATENTLMGLVRQETDMNVCILRLGEILGPERQIVDRLRRMQMQSVSLPGDGSSITNLIHLEDIVAGIDFALCHHLNGIFNLCNDIHTTRKELYAKICAYEGLSPPKWDAEKVSVHGGNKLVSNAKIKAAGYTREFNNIFV